MVNFLFFHFVAQKKVSHTGKPDVFVEIFLNIVDANLDAEKLSDVKSALIKASLA